MLLKAFIIFEGSANKIEGLRCRSHREVPPLRGPRRPERALWGHFGGSRPCQGGGGVPPILGVRGGSGPLFWAQKGPPEPILGAKRGSRPLFWGVSHLFSKQNALFEDPRVSQNSVFFSDFPPFWGGYPPILGQKGGPDPYLGGGVPPIWGGPRPQGGGGPDPARGGGYPLF